LSGFNEFLTLNYFAQRPVQCNDEVCFGLHILPTGEENVKFERKMACVN
jgi:hypothetical protein